MQSIYLYSPRKSLFKDLEMTFVGRETLLDELISSIKDQATAETLQHWMILGTRGMGKSHIITMVYHIVKQDEHLNESWIPVLMNEEEQGIFSLHTLFIRVMTKLGEELSKDEGKKSEEISVYLDSLRSGNKTKDELLESVVAYLKDYVTASGKRLLILLENADDVFTKYLPQKNEVRKFRNILQHDNFLLLLATSPTFFEGISKINAPLYEFFRLWRLQQLNYDQAVELLNSWARLEKKSARGKSPLRFKRDDYRLKVLYHLTGGNPRILLFLYMAVRGKEGIKNAVDTFTRLLEDDLSSFYLSRMRDLSSQVQPIVLALAESEYNLTQTAIARKTFLPARSIGTAMLRLESDGIVRPVTEKKGKNTLYTLTDQLFRLWHKWRISFRERQVIMAIVEFLAIWYRKRELKKMAAYEDLTGAYSREALSFRDTKKFKGYWEVFHIESETYIKGYLKTRDYPSLFKTLTLLEETGYKTDQLSQIAIADLDDQRGLEEGEKYFREKTEDNPEDIEAFINLGLIYFREDNYSASEEIFGHAIKLGPQDVKAWMALGLARDRQENYAGAEEAYGKAVKLDPKYKAAWNNLGAVRGRQENYAGAEEAFLKAVKLDPKDKDAWYNLGGARDRQENYAGAEEAYGKAVKLDPKYKAAWYNLGVARFDQENYAGAEEAYGKALKLDPKYKAAGYNLGVARGRQENYAGAEEAFSKVVKLDPKDKAAWNNLGVARGRQGNYAGAEEAFSKVVKLDPKDKGAWNNLGFARDRQENYAGAEEAYGKAVKLDPKYKAAWYNLGAVRGRQGNYAGAEEALYKLLKLDPTDIVTYSSLSEIMIRNSRIPDLLNLLDKALSLKKTSKHFKAFVLLLRAMAFLFQQDMTPFRKQLAEGAKMIVAIKKEQMHSIVGELSGLMVEIMSSNNFRTIRTYINEIEKISADIAGLINPINHVLDYFEELFSDQKDKKAAADRAQRVLDRISSELRGPVEEMIKKVEKNISKV